MVVSYLNKPFSPSGQKTKHLALLCIGGYCILSGARSLLEEHVPRPSRLHALVLETGATAFVPLPDT
jgi:hypothetical protein